MMLGDSGSLTGGRTGVGVEVITGRGHQEASGLLGMLLLDLLFPQRENLSRCILMHSFLYVYYTLLKSLKPLNKYRNNYKPWSGRRRVRSLGYKA